VKLQREGGGYGGGTEGVVYKIKAIKSAQDALLVDVSLSSPRRRQKENSRLPLAGHGELKRTMILKGRMGKEEHFSQILVEGERKLNSYYPNVRSVGKGVKFEPKYVANRSLSSGKGLSPTERRL